MPNVIQIAPLVIKNEGSTQYVNVYGLDDKGDVYTWNAKKGEWVAYVDAELSKAFTPPKESK